MTKRKPTTIPALQDADVFRQTEDLIFALSRQPMTAGATRSPQVDAVIQKCRDYVNGVMMKAVQHSTGGHDARREARR